MSRGRGFDGVTKLELVAALVNVIVGPFEGRAAIRALHADSMAAQTDQRRHNLSNTWIEKENGDAATGEKRKADEPAEEKKADEAGDDAKKQKTDEPKENGEAAPKKKGRPAKNANGAAPKKETKKREPKKAATESGEPRRSARTASKSS